MTELERNNRINAELARISVYFEKLAENEQSILSPLIQNAAFMRVTLEDLQQIIAEQGPIEQYQNGANQYGMKQSSALQSYNALVKNYASVIKNLFSLLPSMDRPKQDRLMISISETEEEREAEQREQEELERKRKEEIDRAIEYQRKSRELDNKIKLAESQEERDQLIQERKSLTWR